MHRLFALIALLALIAGCAAQVPPPPPTAPLPPTPTALPRLAANVQVAGVDLSGLAPAVAQERLAAELAPLLRPLELRAGAARLTLTPADLDLRLPLEELVAEALAAEAGARIDLRVTYDQAPLRAALETLDQQTRRPAAMSVIGSAASFSRRFVSNPGARLSVTAALATIEQRLRAPAGSRSVTLRLEPSGAPPRLPAAHLQREVEAMAANWDGVVGLYVYDLKRSRVVASLNADTVFSAASVMKAAIMLQAYIALPQFTVEQEEWIARMMVESDNVATNNLLATISNGSGFAAAERGALQMTELLNQLGLAQTFQTSPYYEDPPPPLPARTVVPAPATPSPVPPPPEAPTAAPPPPEEPPAPTAAPPPPEEPPAPTAAPPPPEAPPDEQGRALQPYFSRPCHSYTPSNENGLLWRPLGSRLSALGSFHVSLVYQPPPPTTDVDPYLQTTPAEISRVFQWIWECSQGQGLLLARFPEQLTAARCQEMLDWLARNNDATRLVAGLPPGVWAAHKSGWIEDMQADVGIISAPAGDFLLAVFVYRPALEETDAQTAIAGLSRLVYSWFDPAPYALPNEAP